MIRMDEKIKNNQLNVSPLTFERPV